MSTFIVLPTQLYPWPKQFWKQWKAVIVIEDPHYVNDKMHTIKVWMHRASMREYFDQIPHSRKRYIAQDARSLPSDIVMGHPTDAAMTKQYKPATMIDTPGFILTVAELPQMDTPVQNVFYKRMRVKLNLLMTGTKPLGGKWSYDSSNRKQYPKNYSESTPMPASFDNKYIRLTRPANEQIMYYPTNRTSALKQLRQFVKDRLNSFGPYQDAIRENVLCGYHSCISAPLNIGLITPRDVIDCVLKNKKGVALASIEGFVRQIIGWREFIRMQYVLHGPRNWNHLKQANVPMPKSWYTGKTGIQTLDWSINRVLRYAYAPHIERLMLLANYAVLLRLRYEDTRIWFTRMFIDAYDWVMLNVVMGVNGLSSENRFMTRAYLTNGSYLKKMGLRLSKEDEEQLKLLYARFIKTNLATAKRDYRLASAVKRLTS